MPRFRLESPRPCTIFLFCAHTLCMNYATNTFLLVSSSVQSKQLLYFVHGQGQKREQKPTTKKFVGFHNHSPLLTMSAPRGFLRVLRFSPVLKNQHLI